MKKFTLIVIIISLCVLKGKAQVTDTATGAIGNMAVVTDNDKSDTAVFGFSKEDTLKEVSKRLHYTKPDKDSLFSTEAKRKRTKIVFGQLATGQSNTAVLANYADIDPVEGKLGFNGSVGIIPRLFINLSAAGKIDNNIAQLFTDYKINSSAAVDLRINIMIAPSNPFKLKPEDRSALLAQKGYLNYKRDLTKKKL